MNVRPYAACIALLECRYKRPPGSVLQLRPLSPGRVCYSSRLHQCQQEWLDPCNNHVWQRMLTICIDTLLCTPREWNATCCIVQPCLGEPQCRAREVGRLEP
jgi:hypothetical protein